MHLVQRGRKEIRVDKENGQLSTLLGLGWLCPAVHSQPEARPGQDRVAAQCRGWGVEHVNVGRRGLVPTGYSREGCSVTLFPKFVYSEPLWADDLGKLKCRSRAPGRACRIGIPGR